VDELKKLFESNRVWAKSIEAEDPTFFERLASQQAPRYLWIGCSDSRVPATEICGLDPGEMFVHRNIANQVLHTDINCLSVIQYAVEVLKVSDVIVCGHYGCGGVKGAFENNSLGLIDNWLRNIKEVYIKNRDKIDKGSSDESVQIDLLCEYNVKQQVLNLAHNTFVQEAWQRGQKLSLHGIVYSLKDGLLKNLNVNINSLKQVDDIFLMEL